MQFTGISRCVVFAVVAALEDRAPHGRHARILDDVGEHDSSLQAQNGFDEHVLLQAEKAKVQSVATTTKSESVAEMGEIDLAWFMDRIETGGRIQTPSGYSWEFNLKDDTFHGITPEKPTKHEFTADEQRSIRKEIEKQGAAVRRKDYEEVPLNKQQTEALYESEARSREREIDEFDWEWWMEQIRTGQLPRGYKLVFSVPKGGSRMTIHGTTPEGDIPGDITKYQLKLKLEHLRKKIEQQALERQQRERQWEEAQMKKIGIDFHDEEARQWQARQREARQVQSVATTTKSESVGLKTGESDFEFIVNRINAGQKLPRGYDLSLSGQRGRTIYGTTPEDPLKHEIMPDEQRIIREEIEKIDEQQALEQQQRAKAQIKKMREDQEPFEKERAARYTERARQKKEIEKQQKEASYEKARAFREEQQKEAQARPLGRGLDETFLAGDSGLVSGAGSLVSGAGRFLSSAWDLLGEAAEANAAEAKAAADNAPLAGVRRGLFGY